ncbi:unnamed protein product [Brassica oleracea var. botrytis]
MRPPSGPPPPMTPYDGFPQFTATSPQPPPPGCGGYSNPAMPPQPPPPQPRAVHSYPWQSQSHYDPAVHYPSQQRPWQHDGYNEPWPPPPYGGYSNPFYHQYTAAMQPPPPQPPPPYGGYSNPVYHQYTAAMQPRAVHSYPWQSQSHYDPAVHYPSQQPRQHDGYNEPWPPPPYGGYSNPVYHQYTAAMQPPPPQSHYDPAVHYPSQQPPWQHDGYNEQSLSQSQPQWRSQLSNAAANGNGQFPSPAEPPPPQPHPQERSQQGHTAEAEGDTESWGLNAKKLLEAKHSETNDVNQQTYQQQFSAPNYTPVAESGNAAQHHVEIPEQQTQYAYGDQTGDEMDSSNSDMKLILVDILSKVADEIIDDIGAKIISELQKGGANNDDATDADADDGVESRGLGSRSADNPPEAKATVDTNHDSDLDIFGSSRNLLETGKEKGDSQNGSKDRVKQKGMDSKGTHQPSCLPLPCFRRQTRRKRYHSPSSDESSEDSRRKSYSRNRSPSPYPRRSKKGKSYSRNRSPSPYPRRSKKGKSYSRNRSPSPYPRRSKKGWSRSRSPHRRH